MKLAGCQSMLGSSLKRTFIRGSPFPSSRLLLLGAGSWAMSGTFGSPCEATVDLPKESIVYGAFTGQWKVSSVWVYGAVAINDLTVKEEVDGACGSVCCAIVDHVAFCAYSITHLLIPHQYPFLLIKYRFGRWRRPHL